MTMADTKTANYTDSQVAKLLSLYESLGNEGLEEIAAAIGKSVRSVRSKLVREGAYVASAKPSKVAKDLGPSKKELLNELESIVQFDVTGLNGATKEAIASVIALALAAKAA
jgi:hypothetical protein